MYVFFSEGLQSTSRLKHLIFIQHAFSYNSLDNFFCKMELIRKKILSKNMEIPRIDKIDDISIT